MDKDKKINILLLVLGVCLLTTGILLSAFGGIRDYTAAGTFDGIGIICCIIALLRWLKVKPFK